MLPIDDLPKIHSWIGDRRVEGWDIYDEMPLEFNRVTNEWERRVDHVVSLRLEGRTRKEPDATP